MAISGGSIRIEDDLRQSFSSDLNTRNDTISTTVGSYSSSNVKEGSWFFGIGAEDNSQNANDFVGITPEMLSEITGAIDTYTNNLVSALNKMPDEVNYSQGFKGTAVEAAVKKFVTTVKDVCKDYLESLKAAENQIVESVEKQYSTSDEDVSSQLNTDSSKIHGETPAGNYTISA